MGNLINMVAMSAAIPDGVYAVSLGPLALGLVAPVVAIAAALLLNGRRSQFTTAARRTPRRLTPVQRPAFGVAH